MAGNRQLDRVTVDGKVAALNLTLTPDQATQRDLHFLKDICDSQRIRYLLIQGNDHRPVLAIDRRDRGRLGAALVNAVGGEPFYLRTRGKGRTRTRLVADAGPKIFRKVNQAWLFRRYVDSLGGLKYGRKGAVGVQFWRYGPDQICAPEPNALTRAQLDTSHIRHRTIQRWGTSWPTIDGMFAPRIEDIDFPIDLVVSWVDGSATAWQQQRAQLMSGYSVGEGDDSPARYRHVDELKYSLRSVHMYAPWVRNIFIATDSPRPRWLADTDRVQIVRSADFFADTSVLPVHNSMAVESQLHRIPGLSEHFIYANDDMFFGRRVAPDCFFTAGGISCFMQSPLRIGLGPSLAQLSGFENAARTNRALLLGSYDKLIARHLEHAPVGLRRSVMAELEQLFASEFKRTGASVFRSMTDISVTNSLYHYYALHTGRAYIRPLTKSRYIDTTSRTGLQELAGLLQTRRADFFCLNDGSGTEVSAEHRARVMGDFLRRYFPIPAPWELPQIS